MIYVFKFLLAISLLWPSLALGMTYVGGSWVDDTAYVYNGTSWVEATKWHYTGSAWQEIEAGTPPEDQTLTINPAPVNGSIVEPGDGTNINCGTSGNDCEQGYPFNTNVTLTAIADSGYQLDSWTGVDVDNGDGTANVTMDSAKTVTASFVEESGDECDGFIVCQNFEGTGYDNGETWTINAGDSENIDPDYTAAVGRGAQSLNIANTGSLTALKSPIITTTRSLYVHFMVRYEDVPVTAATTFEVFNDSTRVIFMQYDEALKLRIKDGSSTYYGNAVLNTQQWYHVWIDIISGTGSDAVIRVFVGADNNKPASPDIEITSGLLTADMNSFTITASFMEGTYDQVLTSTAEFMSVEP